MPCRIPKELYKLPKEPISCELIALAEGDILRNSNPQNGLLYVTALPAPPKSLSILMKASKEPYPFSNEPHTSSRERTIYQLIACCSALKCVAVCCSVLHHLRTYRVLQCAQVCCSVLYLLQTYRATVTERYTIPNSNPRVSKVPYLFPKKPYIMSHERTFCELIALLLQHAVLT